MAEGPRPGAGHRRRLTGGGQQQGGGLGGALGGVTDQVGQAAQGVQDTAGQAAQQGQQAVGQAPSRGSRPWGRQPSKLEEASSSRTLLTPPGRRPRSWSGPLPGARFWGQWAHHRQGRAAGREPVVTDPQERSSSQGRSSLYGRQGQRQVEGSPRRLTGDEALKEEGRALQRKAKAEEEAAQREKTRRRRKRQGRRRGVGTGKLKDEGLLGGVTDTLGGVTDSLSPPDRGPKRS